MPLLIVFFDAKIGDSFACHRGLNMMGAAHVMEAARGGDVPAVKAFLDNGGPNSAASLKDEVRALMQYPMCSAVFALPRTAPPSSAHIGTLCTLRLPQAGECGARHHTTQADMPDLRGPNISLTHLFHSNPRGQWGNSMLHYAAVGGHEQLVDTLLARSANPNATSTGARACMQEEKEGWRKGGGRVHTDRVYESQMCVLRLVVLSAIAALALAHDTQKHATHDA